MGYFAALTKLDPGTTIDGLPYGGSLRVCHSTIAEPVYDLFFMLTGKTAMICVDHENAKRLVDVLQTLIKETEDFEREHGIVADDVDTPDDTG